MNKRYVPIRRRLNSNPTKCCTTAISAPCLKAWGARARVGLLSLMVGTTRSSKSNALPKIVVIAPVAPGVPAQFLRVERSRFAHKNGSSPSSRLVISSRPGKRLRTTLCGRGSRGPRPKACGPLGCDAHTASRIARLTCSRPLLPLVGAMGTVGRVAPYGSTCRPGLVPLRLREQLG